MPLTTYAEKKLLSALFLGSTIGQPSSWYIGLIAAPTWTASHTYAVGAYVVPSSFNAITGNIGAIFVATTGGTSGSTEPVWPSTAGATIQEGASTPQLTWTEVTNLFENGNFQGAELVGTNYARAAVAIGSSNWAVLSTAPPTTVQNSAAAGIAFPAAGSNWPQAVGFMMLDQPTGSTTTTNIWCWGTLDTATSILSGNVPILNQNALSISME